MKKTRTVAWLGFRSNRFICTVSKSVGSSRKECSHKRLDLNAANNQWHKIYKPASTLTSIPEQPILLTTDVATVLGAHSISGKLFSAEANVLSYPADYSNILLSRSETSISKTISSGNIPPDPELTTYYCDFCQRTKW